MDYKELGISSITLCVLGVLDLVYFINLIRLEKKLITIVNVQLLIIILAYIGVEVTSIYVYFTIDDIALVLEASAGTKVANNLTFFFIALVQSAYLQHSWLRAETILYYKNKVWYTIFRNILKIATVIIFLPTISKALSFILGMQIFHSLALYINALVGVIIFTFDCFIISSFSRFFLTSPTRDPGHYLIAKYGIIASTGVLLTTTSLATSVILTTKSKSVGNVFSALVFLFFQIPIFAFLALKRSLGESRKSDKTGIEAPVESSDFDYMK